MVLQGQDAWRKHPLLSGCWKAPFPGLGLAFGIFVGYCFLEQMFLVASGELADFVFVFADSDHSSPEDASQAEVRIHAFGDPGHWRNHAGEGAQAGTASSPLVAQVAGIPHSISNRDCS